jgi:hypothetical protein
MAIRAPAAQPDSEEILFENARVSLCLLVNRPARTLRIFDFRAGAIPTKRGYISSQQSVERVFVVEQDGSARSRGVSTRRTFLGFQAQRRLRSRGMAVGAFETSRSVSTDSRRRARQAHLPTKRIAGDATSALRLAACSPPRKRSLQAVSAAARSGRALAIRPFGRDVVRTEYQFTARGGSPHRIVEPPALFRQRVDRAPDSRRTERDVTDARRSVSCATD